MHKKHLIKLLGLTVLAAISVMAVSASAAQAKYLLLLNGVSVNKLNLQIEGLEGHLKAENGLKINCSGATGTAVAESIESGAKVTGTASATFKGCVWVGSEKTCIINDGGAGLINAAGTGEVVMPNESTYIVNAASQNFSTVFTEGVFCTIPEEEEVAGSAHIRITGDNGENNPALPKGTVLLGELLALDLKLGNSKVTELTGEVHISDADNPAATIGIHLVP